jgi:hypothetical protein
VANVQLPSFNTTPTDIDNAGMGELKNVVKSLLNSTIQLNEELTYLLNNLDTRNVNELNAEVIIAGSITADKIQAKSITAELISVNELSAISANLGHIIAGLIESVEIFGSFISTNRYGYPKVELSDTEDMIGAYKSGNNAIQIYSPSDRFSPIIKYITPIGVAYMFYDIDYNAIAITSNDANIHINTTQEINIMGQKGVWINGQQVAPPI